MMTSRYLGGLLAVWPLVGWSAESGFRVDAGPGWREFLMVVAVIGVLIAILLGLRRRQSGVTASNQARIAVLTRASLASRTRLYVICIDDNRKYLLAESPSGVALLSLPEDVAP